MLPGVGRGAGVGKFNVGCLILLVGGGVGGIRSRGVFAEYGMFECVGVILTLVSRTELWELTKKKIKSAVIGIRIKSSSAMTPSRVKRK
jgi:hypothetical protein